jgi:hypothetical protein
LRDPRREEREPERTCIAEHVCCVRENRKRVRDEADHELDDRETGDEGERRAQPAAVRR